ncbi:MAG: phosphoglucomutase [Alistipes sp.]|nr:phosphoglucomutase [Alistipes sp.]
MNIFFGTDGWRALLDSEINAESVAVVAQAFADYINSSCGNDSPVRVAVSYDTRRNSHLFASIFAEVLSGNGITALLSDRVTPTPVLSFATRTMGCAAGVMITASHNPPSYNGIKFKSPLGGPFSLEQTRAVEKFLGASQIVRSDANVAETDFMSDYTAQIERLIDFGAIRRSGLAVLIDSMGGAGLTLTQELLRKHGCKADTIFGEPSETFHGRLAEPIEKNLRPLSEALRGGGYAFGAATDGDADRLGVCLDTGEWLSAQNTILLIVDYLKRVKRAEGGIVKTSSVSDKIRVAFESPQTPVYDVQVGFKYIADIMYEHEIAFGGEESGGFGYGMHIPERDGIFSSLLMLEMLAVSPYRKLSEYLADRRRELGEICYDRIDMHYDREDKNDLLPWLCEDRPASLSGFAVRDIKTFLSSRGIVNGVKMIFEGDCRWLLIRSSETENIIRFYAEGQDDAEVASLLAEGGKLLQRISMSKR